MRRRDASVKFARLLLDTAATLCHSSRMQQTNVPSLVIALDQAINNIQGACSDEDVPVRDLAEWQKAAWLLTVLRNSAATFALTCEITDLTVALCWLARESENLAATVAKPRSMLLDATGQSVDGSGVTAGQSAVADELKSKARIWRAAVNVGRLPQGDPGEAWSDYALTLFLRQDGAATTALFAHTTAKLLQMLTQARSQQEAQAAMYLVSTFAADTAYLAAEVAKP